ncbi:MAG TPA: NAD-dependent epimerase/dehydratase family protein [Flavobacteriales bacterium]|nr:NAD-dependent epimerase/dehydratase family protein [Flavobacteriales bacterium]
MQCILGANGTIGRELSQLLPKYTNAIRQVGRNPRKVNASDETVTADLLDAQAVAKAVQGCDVAYLVAGLKYDTKVWQEQWPKVMRHTIDACKRHGTKLVFFDNVYAYGKVDGPMTEDTPYAPCSKKGEVRARIATTLMDEVKRGELQAMIVRAADFYGPGATLSLTHSTVTERLKAGKTPQWVGNAKATHTFTYTPDAGRSVAVLGNTASAYGQVWHALTSKEAMSGEAYVRLACELAGKPYGIQVAPRWMLSIMGLFVPVLRENMEMMYQFEHDYRFDSSKVERAFQLSATSYKDGIAAALKG